MHVRVQKFGGSSVATSSQIKAIARHLAQLKQNGAAVIVVVSARGDTTDDLCNLAQEVTLTPNRRELDMLLSTGERVSMALMSMAINDLGTPAISFTGSQAGILTDASHNNARIIDLKPQRVAEELKRQHVVVLAGFQGVNPHSKEITTLGRGGSDLTAVAMAAHFKAKTCEILKDVDGIYSADPRIVVNARHRPHLEYDHLLEMTFWGAHVLHYRSVELAKRLGVSIVVGRAPDGQNPSNHSQSNPTLINGEKVMFEQEQILAVNSHPEVRRLIFQQKTLAQSLASFKKILAQSQLPWPQIIDTESIDTSWSIFIAAPQENTVTLKEIAHQTKAFEMSAQAYSTVTATAYGSVGSEMASTLAEQLDAAGVAVHKFIFSPLSITAFVKPADRITALKTFHDALEK